MVATAMLAVVPSLVFAQQQVDNLFSTTGASGKSRGSMLVDVSDTARKALSDGVSSVLLKGIPLANGTVADFQVEAFSVFSPDARIIETDGTNETPVARPQIATYRGRNVNNANELIFLSVAGSDVTVYVRGGKGEPSYIIPVKNNSSKTVAHELAPGDPEVLKDFMCSVTPGKMGTMTAYEKGTKSGHTLLVELMIDAGHPVYLARGSNSSSVATYMANLIGAVGNIYHSEINVVLGIKHLYIWSSADPFGNTNTNSQLTNYDNYVSANRAGVNRDLAHLISAGGGGGLAWINVLCSSSIGTGVSNINANAVFPVAGYHWDLYVLAHELGHNFGSNHTHCYNPPIDCCYNEPAGCNMCPVTGSVTGTIMSYCHLQPGGVNLTFHTRVRDVMRATAEAATSCVSEYIPTAEIEVTGTNSNIVFDGSLTSDPANGTALGTVQQGGSAVSRVFTIYNAGGASLNLTGTPRVQISGSPSFSISAQPSSASVAPLTSLTFTVQLNPNSSGPNSATITILNDDSDENPYTFVVDATVANLGTPTTFSFNGSTNIPDNVPAGINVNIPVSGINGTVADVDFRINGSSCSATPGDPNVGLGHEWVGDLVLTLTSPDNTSVIIINRPGGGSFGAGGINFCNTLLDDDGAGSSIQAISSGGAPYSGTYQPANPLAAFDGEEPNGTWVLNAADHVGPDAGTLRSVSLIITGAEVTSVQDWTLY